MMFAKETYVHENDKNYAIILSYLLDAFIRKKKYAHVHITVNFVLGFNDTSTLMGHFVSSHREREKRDSRDSTVDEREGQGRKRKNIESEETEEIKHSLSTLTRYKDSRSCPTVSQYQLDAPVTPLPHPTTHIDYIFVSVILAYRK